MVNENQISALKLRLSKNHEEEMSENDYWQIDPFYMKICGLPRPRLLPNIIVRDQTFKKCQSLAFRVKSVFSTVIGSLDDVENIKT